MRMTRAEMRGGSYGDAYVRHGVGDFGISVLHRPRRRQQAAGSSLNRLPGSPPRVSYIACEAMQRSWPRVSVTPSGLVARRPEGYAR